MRTIQKCASFGVFVPEPVGERHDARQTFGSFALLGREPGATLERGGGDDAVDERVGGRARFDGASGHELQASLREARTDDAIEVHPRSNPTAQDRSPAEHFRDVFHDPGPSEPV